MTTKALRANDNKVALKSVPLVLLEKIKW